MEATPWALVAVSRADISREVARLLYEKQFGVIAAPTFLDVQRVMEGGRALHLAVFDARNAPARWCVGRTPSLLMDASMSDEEARWKGFHGVVSPLVPYEFNELVERLLR